MIMRLMLLATLLLFTYIPIQNYEARCTQHETHDQQQHRQWRLAAFTVGEKQIGNKESDPYDPRQDSLYRLYLAATVLGVVGGVVGVCLIFWQVKLLRQTVNASGEQSKAMGRHIDEAARSANAMENI